MKKSRLLKRSGALAISAAVLVGMSTTALADPVNLSNGEVGGFTEPDVTTVQDKNVNIQKGLKVFNPDEEKIYAPAISYTYTIAAAAGDELVTITDDAGDHVSGLATTVTVNPGVITNVTMTGTDTNIIAWSNDEVVTASEEGTENYKNLKISFDNVVFTAPGVYRYKITETASGYVTNGVTDGGITNVRYLDVYVMRSSTYDATSIDASDWSIYGYVCINPESVTNSAGGTTNVTPSTAKTNGFVEFDPDNDSSTDNSVTADEYHTYNLTVTKDLIGDPTMNGNKFVFDVAWTNETATGTFQFAVETSDTPEVDNVDIDSDADTSNGLTKVGGADAVSTSGKDGDPLIADEGFVKYIGIPNGTKVSVTETNNVIGTVYSTRVFETVDDGARIQKGFAAEAAGGTSDKGEENGIANAVATMDPSENAIYVQASAPDADSNVTIDFTNTLSIISPTGYVVRFAPYMILLGLSVVVLAVFKRTREEED